MLFPKSALYWVALVWIVLCVGSLAPVQGIEIWLSESDTLPYASSADRVPTVTVLPDQANIPIYIWGRPDPGRTLTNISMVLHTDQDDVVAFSSVVLHNPVLETAAGGRDVRRYEFISEVAPPLTPSDQSVRMQGFSILEENVEAVGVGVASSGYNDPYFHGGLSAWLLATIRFSARGPSGAETALYLQIGDNGLNQDGGQSSSDAMVVLGDLSDGALNGQTQRGMDSDTPDALIRIAPSADLNGDGNIDAADAGLMFANWSSSGTGDLNSDDVVDAADAGILFAAWTGDAVSKRSVPEPAMSRTGAILLWLTYGLRRRRLAAIDICRGAERPHG